MKRKIQHILALLLLTILPAGQSFVYGDIYIERNGTELRKQGGASFSSVSEAASYKDDLYKYSFMSWRTNNVNAGIQDGDSIVITEKVTESLTIQITKKNIKIKTSGNPLTIEAGTNFSATQNCLLYINGGSVTIDGTITLDASPYTTNLPEDERKFTVVRLSGDSPSLTLNGNLTGGNMADSGSSGGGLTVESGSATINGNIYGCKGKNGGGVYVKAGASVEISEDASIYKNEASIAGGGVFLYKGTEEALGGKLTISGGTIGQDGQGNSAPRGGGIYVNDYAQFTINSADASIQYNTAKEYGGGVYISSENGENSLAAGTINNNTALKGGGIYLNGCKETTFGAVTITGNTATNAGGGIYATSSIVTLADAAISVSSNVTDSGSDDGYDDGAGIYADNTTLTVSNGVFDNNEAKNKGRGGGIFLKGGTFSNTGGTFSENKAYKGGGLAASTNSVVNADGGSNSAIVFSGNESNNAGGAIWMSTDKSITLKNVTFTGNKATDSSGGAISVYQAGEGSSIESCTFTGNQSKYNGCTIYVEKSGDFQIKLPVKDSEFTNNGSTNETTNPNCGTAIFIDQINPANIHTVVLSGTNTFGEGQTIRLDNKAVLTKGTDMAFTDGDDTNPQPVKVDVYPADPEEGRDILVSGLASASGAAALRGLNAGITLNEGTADVTDDDLQKLNVVAPHYHTVRNTTDKVIELLKNYLLTISCTGLQANESAAYRVKDASNEGGQVLYNVILTGNDTGNPVSKTIEMDYEPAMPLTVGSSWEWTYNYIDGSSQSQAVNGFNEDTKEASCSFTVTKKTEKTEKLHPHGEHSITLGNTTTNE